MELCCWHRSHATTPPSPPETLPPAKIDAPKEVMALGLNGTKRFPCQILLQSQCFPQPVCDAMLNIKKHVGRWVNGVGMLWHYGSWPGTLVGGAEGDTSNLPEATGWVHGGLKLCLKNMDEQSRNATALLVGSTYVNGFFLGQATEKNSLEGAGCFFICKLIWSNKYNRKT